MRARNRVLTDRVAFARWRTFAPMHHSTRIARFCFVITPLAAVVPARARKELAVQLADRSTLTPQSFSTEIAMYLARTRRFHRADAVPGLRCVA